MAYSVSFDEENGIVCVTFSGSAVKDDHYSAFDEALRLCKEHVCSKLLVDFSGLCASTISTMESFAIGEAVAKNPFNLRIAHVFPKHARARENVHFASAVEVNRGRVTREFETGEQARNWLQGLT